MNPWTMLLIGFVLGWLIEFAVDWFYWRRKSAGEKEIEELQNQIQAAESRIAELEAGAAAAGEEAAGDYGEEELEPGDWVAEEDMADGELDSVEADSDFAKAAAAAGITAAALADEDEEPPIDDSETVGADDLDDEFLAAESDLGEDLSAAAEIDSAEGGFDTAGKIAAVGAAAAVVAGMDDDSPNDGPEIEAAEDLGDEIQAAESDLGEDFSAATELDSAEGGFDTAGKIAAVGAAAAVVAGMDDDSDIDESELAAVNLDDEIPASEIDSANEAAALRMVTGAAAASRDLSYVEGIGPVYAGKLKEVGVDSPQTLLERGATPKGRKELAEETGISGHLILTWINHADLYRVKGLGSEYADLLKASGVDTVIELAQRNPQNLYQRMSEVNETKHLVRQLPSQGHVADWVSQAKTLPRVVSY